MDLSSCQRAKRGVTSWPERQPIPVANTVRETIIVDHISSTLFCKIIMGFLEEIDTVITACICIAFIEQAATLMFPGHLTQLRSFLSKKEYSTTTWSGFSTTLAA